MRDKAVNSGHINICPKCTYPVCGGWYCPKCGYEEPEVSKMFETTIQWKNVAVELPPDAKRRLIIASTDFAPYVDFGIAECVWLPTGQRIWKQNGSIQLVRAIYWADIPEVSKLPKIPK